MKRLALLALLLASSSLVAAPAPLPKPQRKAERPVVRQRVVRLGFEDVEDVVVVNFGFVAQPIRAPQAAPPPVQAPDADPAG